MGCGFMEDLRAITFSREDGGGVFATKLGFSNGGHIVPDLYTAAQNPAFMSLFMNT